MTIIEELKGFASLTSGRQREYFDQVLRDAHVVQVVKVGDVLDDDQIDIICNLDLREKECYRNATLISCAIPGCNYVEGKFAPFGFGIEHAWNEYKGKYFDATSELVLNSVPEETEYVALGEYTAPEVMAICERQGVYGEIYFTKFRKSVKR
jgi:hypothetical protein